MNISNFRHRLLYGLLVGIVTWYAQVIPIALAGYWRKLLIPGLGMITDFWHVYLIVLAWAIFRSKKAIIITTSIMLVFLISVLFLLKGYPCVSMIERFGLKVYLVDWAQAISTTLVAPLMAAYLLTRADSLAPKFIKNWSTVNA